MKSVTVTNQDGQVASQASGFEYMDTPTISSLSVDYGILAGGGTLTIAGTNFSSFGGNPMITIGGNACSSVTYTNSNSIDCVGIPSGIVGAADIIVTNTSGESVTAVNIYTYQIPPTISSLSTDIASSAGGDSLTITGTNFSNLGGNPTVMIGGTSCNSVVYSSDTSLACTMSSGTPGLYTVQVTNFDGQSSSGGPSITYLTTPSISTISPSSVKLGDSQVITITGSNFTSLAGGMSVEVGGYPCTGVTFNSSTEISCTTDNILNAGVHDVVVTNPLALQATLFTSFSVGTFSLGSDVSRTLLNGTTLFVADDNEGLEIYDATSPGAIGARLSVIPSITGVLQLEMLGSQLAVLYYDGASKVVLIDVSTPSSPVLNPALTLSMSGVAYSMAISAPSIFVGGSGGLIQVVDATNPASLTQVVNNFATGGSTINQMDINGTTMALAAGNGFYMLDVSTPTTPTIYGSAQTLSGISAYSGVAFVSASEIALSGSGNIKFANISSPGTGSVIGNQLSLSPSSVTKLKVSGPRLVALGNQAVAVYNVSNPSTTSGYEYIMQVASTDASISGNTMAVAQAAGGVRLFDVTSSPTLLGTNIKGYLGGTPSSSVIDEANDRMYIAAGKQVNIIDIIAPFSPTLLGHTIHDQTSMIMGVALHNGFLYYATSQASNNLRILDVSTPSTPAVVGTPPSISGTITSLKIEGNVMVVGTSSGMIYFYTITDINTFALSGSISAGANASYSVLDTISPRAFFTGTPSSLELYVVDYTTIASPTQIASISGSGANTGLTLNETNDLAIVFKNSGFPVIYDVSSSPSLNGNGTDSTMSSAVFGKGSNSDILYATLTSSSFKTYDASGRFSLADGAAVSLAPTSTGYKVLGSYQSTVYLASPFGQLRAVDVSDLSAPYAP